MRQNPNMVEKRNGNVVEFDRERITNAMRKASIACGNALSNAKLCKLTNMVIRSVRKRWTTTKPVHVEFIQDAVERVLMRVGEMEIAKEFILYRDLHSRRREAMNSLFETYHQITYGDAEDADFRRENANIDSSAPMGMMLKFGSESAKKYALDEMIPADAARAHENGDIHIHDLDFAPTGTLTCVQIDLSKLFKDGFETGHGYLREPKGIISRAALACIAIQSSQNDFHGGQSVPKFDYDLAPGVADTYVTEFYKSVAHQFAEKFDMSEAKAMASVIKEWCHKSLPSLNEETMNQYMETFYSFFETMVCLDEIMSFDYKVMKNLCSYSKEMVAGIFDTAKRVAAAETDRETYQAMEAFIHNLNTMHSRAGAQVPFSSINYGTDTSPEGRMVMKNLLLATDAGLGEGETPIFPVQIFKVKDGINYNKEDPNYDLFKLAMKVSAKRLFPNFSFIDAPYNLQYYKEGNPDTEIAYMGCRTRVIGNIYNPKKEIVTGRGNLSFTSINLPRIAIESHGDIDVFYQKLDKMMHLCFKQLKARFDFQKKRRVYNFPFAFGQGIWIDSDKLDQNDSVEEIIKNGTLSVGFIGLAETLVALIGKHHGESEEAQKLGLEIVGRMRRLCDEESQKTKMNYTLLATPAEGLSGRFVNMDRKKYGVLKDVTDREYYTNSIHVPVYYNTSAFHKIQVEAPYHALTNAGHISYVEIDGDPLQNLESFEAIIRCMKESGIGYGSINHAVDRDPVCGYVGIINDVCPRCGRRAGEAIPIELANKYKKMKHNACCD